MPAAEVVALLNEPRNSRHMPMASISTLESAAAWVAAKDGQWAARSCYGGHRFRQFRLTRSAWARLQGAIRRPARAGQS